MKLNILFLYFVTILSLKSFSQPASLPLIPKPAELIITEGVFKLSAQTVLVQNKLFKNEELLLQKYLLEHVGNSIKVVAKIPAKGNYIHFKNKKTLIDTEAYHLNINPQHISIEATSGAGIFYGLQTLFQLLPLNGNQLINIPSLVVNDHPRYKWRGMHLDCSRHFFPVNFVKMYIDYLAMYKMNSFHWHLTDDQGWRIEIKKYPVLTSTGAYRNGSMIGHYRDHTFDSIKYGGYYTQDEIKDVIAYAAQRHINIVPEIEMPGHAVAALAAYPQYACSGKPVEVSKQWGVESNVFCPTEETFLFLENILTEVIALFPSKYIHIGGDEVPKEEWNNSAYCKALMLKENLKDAHELQGYFMKRIEKFVNSKGRKIIGWDEILEGGLAPNAAVMSWRGTEGGITAAKQKHFVVMSPGSHCYFDHYQGNPDNEPVAIGGYTPIEKVYAYEPTPDELTAEESKYIMGAQGNVWTEYIHTPEEVEYMAMPRMAALAEVLWSPKQQRDYINFRSRLLLHFKLLDQQKINYAKSVYELKTLVSPANQNTSVLYSVTTIADPTGIRYTTDSSEPSLQSHIYSEPILINKSTCIKTAYFKDDKQLNKTLTTNFIIHKATGKTVTLKDLPSPNFSADGPFTLVNGIRGNLGRFDNKWLGFCAKNMEAVIDFGEPTSYSNVTIDYLNLTESWIHPPQKIIIYTSTDGLNFSEVKTVSSDELKKYNNTIQITFTVQHTQYLKVVAESIGIIPSGFPGAGNEANLFIDEIVVE
ncbi:MAG: family 20 glycosylhydrolase [Bacteroidia bacterium]|nr:family 20 glycosylhydrolase [Bacteroidia bacterium]